LSRRAAFGAPFLADVGCAFFVGFVPLPFGFVLVFFATVASHERGKVWCIDPFTRRLFVSVSRDFPAISGHFPGHFPGVQPEEVARAHRVA
jgi:hypothetical protein